MNKRIISLMVMAMVVTLSANAQFEKEKYYIGASLSNLSLSYNGADETSFGLGAKAGYLFDDDLMVTAQLEYDKKHGQSSYFKAGVGARYYIVQNGLYIGLSAHYLHSSNFDDFQPGIQLGYAFFLSRTVTIEPELYYDQSLKDHGDYSTVGIRIGFGVYL